MSNPPFPARRALTRRKALSTLALGIAATALPFRAARSADAAQKLDVHDPAAMKLGYVESASQVDVKKFPHFVPGSNCENCLLLQGKPGNNYRPCSLFTGKLVSVSGWCSGWTAEM
ncbi:MAG TPA: high-potential iron-sulfur protein [Steroidobacteraceae bacterium]|nr:high-potential iron-sulfur protein [Steroidobacteraceae bacterium]